MEQLIYTSVGKGEHAGYQIAARSAGLSDSECAILRGLFGMHGKAPKDFPSEGVFSFIEHQPGRFCAWMTYRREGSDNDRRRTIWVHAFVLDAPEFERAGRDPMSLVDAGLFLKPGSEHMQLGSVPVLAPAGGPDLQRLHALTPLQIDILTALVLARAHAYVSWHKMELAQLRALQCFLPEHLRHHLTFYGLVTGSPPIKAKLIFSFDALSLKDMDADASAGASIENEAYRGENPSPFACAVAEHVKKQDADGLRDLLSLAEALGEDVFTGGGGAFMKLHGQQKDLIQKRKVGQLVEAFGELEKTARNKREVRMHLTISLLEIVENSLQSSDYEALDKSLHILCGANATHSHSEMAELERLVELLWRETLEHPKLLPISLGTRRIFPGGGRTQLAQIDKGFDSFADQARRSMLTATERARYWRKAASAAVACGRGRIAELAGAYAVLESIEQPDALSQEEFDGCLSMVRSQGAGGIVLVALKGSNITHCRQVAIFKHLLANPNVVRSCSDLRPWLKCWRGVSREWHDSMKETICERFGADRGLLPLVQELVSAGDLSAEDAFGFLQRHPGRQLCSEARTFVKGLPVRGRACLAMDVLGAGGEETARDILDAYVDDELNDMIHAVEECLDGVDNRRQQKMLSQARRQMKERRAELMPVAATAKPEAGSFSQSPLFVVIVMFVLIVAGGFTLWWQGRDRETKTLIGSGRSSAEDTDAWRKDLLRMGDEKVSLFGHEVLRRNVVIEAALLRDPHMVRGMLREIGVAMKEYREPAGWSIGVLELLKRQPDYVLLRDSEVLDMRKELDDLRKDEHFVLPDVGAAKSAEPWYQTAQRCLADLDASPDAPGEPLTLTTAPEQTRDIWQAWHNETKIGKSRLAAIVEGSAEEFALTYARQARELVVVPDDAPEDREVDFVSPGGNTAIKGTVGAGTSTEGKGTEPVSEAEEAEYPASNGTGTSVPERKDSTVPMNVPAGVTDGVTAPVVPAPGATDKKTDDTNDGHRRPASKDKGRDGNAD